MDISSFSWKVALISWNELEIIIMKLDPSIELIQEFFHHDTEVYCNTDSLTAITDIPADSEMTSDYKWKLR